MSEEKKVVKLSKAQKALHDMWVADYQRVMATVNAVITDNLTMRLEQMAKELGVDLNDGDWRFDNEEYAFVQDAPPPKVKPTIPRKKKTKKIAEEKDADV